MNTKDIEVYTARDFAIQILRPIDGQKGYIAVVEGIVGRWVEVVYVESSGWVEASDERDTRLRLRTG